MKSFAESEVGRLGAIVLAIALSILAFGFWKAWDHLKYGSERRIRAEIQSQIAHAKTTHRGITFRLEDPIAMDEFANSVSKLNGKGEVELDIEYTHGVDEFLERIRGLRGVKSVLLVKCIVSEVGIKHLATLPDLESLNLYHVTITDTGLASLATCPKLVNLSLAPLTSKNLSISAVVALPSLRVLSIDGTNEAGWLEAGIEEIAHSESLTDLSLYAKDLTREDVVRLRWRLPNCTVRAFRRAAGPHKDEIAPLGELPGAPE